MDDMKFWEYAGLKKFWVEAVKKSNYKRKAKNRDTLIVGSKKSSSVIKIQSVSWSTEAMWYCRESTELESNSSEVKSQLHHLLFKKKKIKKQITSFLPGFDVLIYILVMLVHSSKDAALAHDRGSVCWFQQERSVTLCLPDIFFFFPVGRTGLCQLQWIP